MNALCYKVVFSKRLGSLVAVGEHTVGQGKAAGTGVRSAVFPSSSAASVDNFVGLLKSIFASVALSFVAVGFATAAGPAANTLPTDYSVNSGNVAISSTSSATNAAMTIKQTTDKASVNWNSFSIGSGAKVDVQQNNANSVLLNRVVGNDPSQIFGKLTANGQVILINPNGVVFGKGGSVTASAFTASTFGMTDGDFHNGKHKFTRNGSTAGVTVEEGARIDTTGYVALMGASVDNQGAITTQGGAVVLAAGDSVALPSALTDNIGVPLSGKVRLELLPSTLNAMVANSGTITTEGGQVLMQAAALSDAVASITHTGTIDTTGAQGGAVTLLADGGNIKVNGSLKANSTSDNTKGGDIVIGRDEITGVLAHATDVSGAKLESLGGFVESSGDYLKTEGISVKAKDWLLDPTDINIVATGTLATPDTPFTSAGGTKTYKETAGINTSEVLTSTIKEAIDSGTNVTITTANSAVGAYGSGNITIFDKLDFANNSGQDATLTLLAKNGITQNTGAFIKQTAGSNNNKVDVVMTSEGLNAGAPGSSTSSKGITLNDRITTNGDVTLNGTTNNSLAASASNAIGVDIKSTATITANKISITGKSESSFGIQSASVLNATNTVTLDGTSKNWVGVVTTGAITATNGLLSIKGTKGTATDASGYQGININSNLTGASVSLVGTSYGYYGVHVQNVTVKSTSGDVYIEGTGSNTAATTGQNESSGTRIAGIVDAKAKAIIKGTTSDAGLYQGLIISNQVKGASVEITGIASNHIGAAVNNGASVTASTGDVIINGTSNTNEGLGVGSQSSNGGATITATAGSVTLTGTSGSASLNKSGTAGVRFWGSNIVTASNAINITGTVDTQVAKYGVGVEFQRYPTAARLTTSTGDISINGTVTGNGGGSGVSLTQSGTNGQAPMMNAGGKFTLRGNNRAASGTGNGSAAIFGGSGIQVTAGSDIVIQAETQNVAVNAINFTSSPAAVSGNASFKSTSGNVLIQANQGAINFTNALPTNYVTGTYTALTDISGKNITIDNTGAGMAIGAGTSVTGSGGMQGASIVNGGSISATGVIVKGSGTSTYASGGAITLNSSVGLAITATENVNIAAVNTGSTQSGLYTGAATNISGKNVTIDGTSLNSNGVITNGTITAISLDSNNGNVTITGTSTGAPISPLPQTASALSLQGVITAYNNVSIVANNTNASNGAAVAYVNKEVTATKGKIGITTSTLGTTANALQLASGANLSAKTEVNIKTDTLSIDTSATPATISAPTGTVTIKTDSAAAKIDVGAGDAGSATTSARTLGLSNAELNRINAGELVIGDSNNAGGLKVSAAITTNSNTGNLTLQTSGGMLITGAVTAGNTALKNITLLATSSAFGLTHQAKVKGDNITMRAESNATTGNILGYYGAGSGAQFDAASALNLTGITSSQGNGFYTIDGSLTAGKGITITGTSANGQGVGFEKNVNITNTANDIIITGTASNTANNNSTTGVHTEGIWLKGSKISNNGGSTKLTAVNGNFLAVPVASGSIPNEIINSNTSTGIIQITAGNANATNSGGVDGTALTINQNGNSGVLVSSSGTGNVTAPKIVNAGMGSVIIAAGSQITAGDGSGGQVKTVSGNTVTQNSLGQTYLYTGNANDTGALSAVGGFTNGLFLSTIGADTINAASNTAYETSGTRNTISGGANTQVMFREKLAMELTNGASIGHIYGDANTKNDATAKSALWLEMKNTLGTANSGTITKITVAGTFKITGTALVNDLTEVSLSSANYSRSGYLNYTSGGYTYGAVSGNNYTPTLASGQVAKVTMGQKSLGANIADVQATYGTNGGTGSVALIGVSGADNVSAGSASLVGTALSSSGNLKAGTYVQSVGGDLGGADAGNYTFNGTSSNNYVVNKLGLSTQIASVATTYGTAANTGAVSIGAGLTGDAMTVVSTGPASVVAAAYSSSGNLKAGSYQQAASARLDGADSGNYFIETPTVANYVVKKLDLTGASIAGVNTNYGNTAEKGAVSFANVVGSDQVGAAVSIVDAANSTSGSLKVGSYKQTASVLTGVDGGNYQFGGVTTATANYNVTQKLITTANVSDVTTVYGTPAAVGTVSLGADAVAGDKVQATSVATLQGATFSSSNNLKAGAYKQSIAAGLSGDDASNYIFQGTEGKANFVVNKLALTGGTIADVSTVYGTPQTPTVALQGVIATDKVSGKAGVVDGQYSSSGNLKVGSYQQNIDSLQGDDAANYSASNIVSGKRNYDVTPRSLAATYLANNKVVDGNTNASVVGSVNAIAGDKVAPTHTSATFDTATIGNNKTVTISGIALSGADASNYVLDPIINANNKAYATASIVAAQVNLAPTVPTSKQAKVSVGSANPFQLASAEEPEDDVCSATSVENCYCEESAASQGVSICYESSSELSTKR